MMNRTTGKAIDGEARLAQKMADILTTPLGSRVMRRTYGSLLFQIIDAPLNAATTLLLTAATAIALAKWMPEIQLSKVSYALNGNNTGYDVTVTGRRLDVPSTPFSLTLPIPLH